MTASGDSDAAPAQDTPWAQSPAAVTAALAVDPARGLSADAAARRLREHGPNLLRRQARRRDWHILRDQFASLIVALLAAAAALAFAFGEHVEGLTILAVLVLNAAIGFVTERHALRSMDALRALGQMTATVRRDGAVQTLPAERLVPGDVLVLEAGDVLTADVRLLDSSRLQADESTLTGESLPVDKDAAATRPDAALGARSSMLFKGTAVTRGAGEAIVVATGMHTELGRLALLVEQAEPGTTPLEQRLAGLARRLIVVTLVIAALVAIPIAASGRDFVFAIEMAIALAVATIPEGLPIVATVALARGMWRMARHNALVEVLAAVETLGSTTVILSDKTGTLTENRMTVVEIALARGTVVVSGTGLAQEGRFELEGTAVSPVDCAELAAALRTAVLCNDASLACGPDGRARASGDPTEIALLVAGAKGGLDQARLREQWPELREIAFDPETQRMATLHSGPPGCLAAVKGAPERILAGCTRVLGAEGSEPLDAAARKRWLARAEAMAARGERVLALAGATPPDCASFTFEDLELYALVGLFDPPRESARAAIAACREAGIRLVMVTGDHGATARTVARAVGLLEEAGEAPAAFVDASSLPAAAMHDAATARALRDAAVIARANPRQKLELIALHQQAGAIVAMTGDGVNDAPALKKADIGVAMGLRGTQVAREAADMVLRDDELGTIVMAVEQGRAIFDNVRKFVVYLMSCNASEIFAIGAGALLPGPLPLLPLQILFLNLVTDVFPALALGLCEGSPALMQRPPRDPREPVLTRAHWRELFAYGVVIALSVLGALAVAVGVLDRHGHAATTIAFLTLAMAQLWHVFSMRDKRSTAVVNEVTRNPWIWAAIALCLVLLGVAVHWPPLATVLSLSAPGWAGWGVAFAASLVPLALGQAWLALCGRRVEQGEAGTPA